MDTQKTSLSQKEIDELIVKLSEKFDITQIQKLSFEDIQKVADKYLASDNPEFKEIGQELKTLDPKIFELSPAESSLQELHSIMMKLGKTKYQADRFGISVLKLASQATIQDIVSSMNEEAANQWTNLQMYNPNVLQQMYLLDETSKLLLKKSFDEIYELNLDKAVKMASNVLSHKKETTKTVESLTEDQANTVLAAFNANQYEIAIQLIYNFAKENAA